MHPSLDTPGDRRRFVFYAKLRGIQFEIADPNKNYDYIVLSQRADLSVWGKRQQDNCKIIYDCIDSYIMMPRTDPKALLRGLAKFLSRQSKHLQLSHWRAIEEMCENSAAVICSTPEQRAVLQQYCPNTHIILDAHPECAQQKTDYSTKKPFKLVWEGFGENLRWFSDIAETLNSLARKHSIELHIFTNLTYGKYLSSIGMSSSAELIHKYIPDAIVHPWQADTVSQGIIDCDLALIPVDLNNAFAAGKPINKLLFFWRMGMPTVVSATPAYKQAMQAANLRMACSSKAQWNETLLRYMTSENLRREAGEKGRTYAQSQFNTQSLAEKWDELFRSII
jgi:hypothetical protein